ncbi:MAG: sigma 54-interacting transcriptional regulator [Gammaproteobacteria bacterium]|nr:sigma 54-interacting transcriptional regulator [Gammaproteobacteria bacterium]
MTASTEVRQRLTGLQARLDAVNRAWTVDNYDSLFGFYVDILPQLMNAERCTIFIVDARTDRIWSKIGTDIQEREIEAPKEDSIVGQAVSSGQCIIENDLHRRPGFHREVESQTGFQTRNLVCAPIRSLTGHGVTGAVQVLNRNDDTPFSEQDARLVQEVADLLAMAIENVIVNQEILQITTRLNQEVAEFRSAYLGDVPFTAESQAMRSVLDMVRMVSATPVNVFIHGENGTGKEVIARMIHENSTRRDKPFVAVNCASIPENLMESEFFGYEKGAFTGASGSRAGRFEEADNGILFLDEVADMPMSIQPKFLRAIQEGEGCRLGSNKVHSYDLRIISATNRDLRQAVKDGDFREDLFYRLFAVEIFIPPLRERREDIAPLAQSFYDDISRRFKKKLAGFSPEVMTLLEQHPWPGNVRQLRREVERLVALTPEGQPMSMETCSSELRSHNPGSDATAGTTLRMPDRVRDLEVELIHRALKESRGNKVTASRLLGITRQGLHKKIKRYNIELG